MLVGVRSACRCRPGARAALGRTETAPAAGVVRACSELPWKPREPWAPCSHEVGCAGVQPDRGLGALGPLATTAFSGLLSSPFGAWWTQYPDILRKSTKVGASVSLAFEEPLASRIIGIYVGVAVVLG